MELENVVLDENDFEKLRQRGLSEEDINILKDTMGLIEVSKNVPDDVDALLKRMNEYFADCDTFEKVMNKYFGLAESDPEFFTQIISMQTLLGVTDSPISETWLYDALRQIRDAEGEYKEDLKKQLLNRVRGLDEKSKADFVSEVGELSKQEKEELLGILNKK